MEKKSFIYYCDWAELLLDLPEALRLKIDDAVKRYVLYGEEPTDRDVLYSMFGAMRKQIDRDNEKWNEKREKNRDNANKRWGNATASDRMRPYANDAVNVNANANVNKKESKPKKDRLSLPLDQRKKEFQESIQPYIGEYGADMCNDFFSYWTEPNLSHTKMRYELQRTWDVKRRLRTWSNKQFNK